MNNLGGDNHDFIKSRIVQAVRDMRDAGDPHILLRSIPTTRNICLAVINNMAIDNNASDQERVAANFLLNQDNGDYLGSILGLCNVHQGRGGARLRKKSRTRRRKTPRRSRKTPRKSRKTRRYRRSKK